MNAGCSVLFGLAALVLAIEAIRRSNAASREADRLRLELDELNSWVRKYWQALRPEAQPAPQPEGAPVAEAVVPPAEVAPRVAPPEANVPPVVPEPDLVIRAPPITPV